MMFTLITFYGSAMDGHSKREGLEIFNMDKKIYITRFLLLNQLPICQIFTIFSKMVTWHIMCLTFIFVYIFEFYPFLSLNSYFILFHYLSLSQFRWYILCICQRSGIENIYPQARDWRSLPNRPFEKKRTFHASGFCFPEHIRAFVICVIYVCYLGLLNLNLKEITRWVWS